MFLLTSCLTDNEPEPNIYKSGVWCSGGEYNLETRQYEATVLVTINSIDTVPLKNKKAYLQLPEEVNCIPEICTTDEKGQCLFLLSGNQQLSTNIYVWTETDNIADSTTQASAKSKFFKSSKTFIKITQNAPLFFEHYVQTVQSNQTANNLYLELKVSDHKGILSKTPYYLELKQNVIFFNTSGTTDTSGIINLNINHDGTGIIESFLYLEGIAQPTTFPIEF
ncbi:MAG: hypothetical protein PF689_11585 [Deltaproteobacteria bacterium]|nr:hypothetical protein [Deltaproteobacteria bacterium]